MPFYNIYYSIHNLVFFFLILIVFHLSLVFYKPSLKHICFSLELSGNWPLRTIVFLFHAFSFILCRCIISLGVPSLIFFQRFFLSFFFFFVFNDCKHSNEGIDTFAFPSSFLYRSLLRPTPLPLSCLSQIIDRRFIQSALTSRSETTKKKSCSFELVKCAN